MTLEAESGISPDPSPEITRFRENILSGKWMEVEALLENEQSLGRINHRVSGKADLSGASESLFGVDDQVLNAVRFLVAQEKYLELLELRRIRKALVVLRFEVAPLVNFPELHSAGNSTSQKLKSPVSTIGNSLHRLSVNSTSGHTTKVILSCILGKREIEEENTSTDVEQQLDDARVKKLSLLSSLMMCGTADEVRERANWPGVLGGSRIRLLEELQELIPPQRLLPHERLPRLLEQSKDLQRLQCLYHVTNPRISLLSNHSCSRSSFPTENSHVLSRHTNEVWRIEWSHDGTRLASGGQSKTCIIWKMKNSRKPNLNGTGSLNGSSHLPSSRGISSFHSLGEEDFDFEPEFILDSHPESIGCIAWSPDDSVLLTGSECTITMWNTKTGFCIATMVKHQYDVSALSWLPDGKGFVSGGMDSDVLFWDLKGQNTFTWHASPTRVVDLAVSPDGNKLVAIGYANLNNNSSTSTSATSTEAGNGNSNGQQGSNQDGSSGSRTTNGEFSNKQRRLHIFNIPQKEEIAMIPLNKELTCISISDDSKYALLNQSPNEVLLYSLEDCKLVRRFVGQKQGQFVIRSCFGGLDRNFILSGSEDGKIYVWHLESGNLIEVLKGHAEEKCVNAVAWNPVHPAMFASASDDSTVRNRKE
ncbi:WD40-repeat-containing domain protein [Phakopsora pachyrhizi]|nr:WD40-repeat-containing domain protein [Phakopsora pachyrhizi]